jgi:hypothetical protein
MYGVRNIKGRGPGKVSVNNQAVYQSLLVCKITDMASLHGHMMSTVHEYS